jgi:hypothetical protein
VPAVSTDPARRLLLLPLRAQEKEKLYMRSANPFSSWLSRAQEKEKLYMELKNILARQPGPEVAEQLSIYQANLREKTKQMKAMASELNMYQAQVRTGGARHAARGGSLRLCLYESASRSAGWLRRAAGWRVATRCCCC